jgi:hypothetical protein
MQHNIIESVEIPKFLLTFYQEAAISPADLLRNYALNHILSKIHKYEAEDNHFRKKYSCNFEDFKIKVESMQDEENFEWEDDLMDWEFAVENLAVWKRKQQLFGIK